LMTVLSDIAAGSMGVGVVIEGLADVVKTGGVAWTGRLGLDHYGISQSDASVAANAAVTRGGTIAPITGVGGSVGIAGGVPDCFAIGFKIGQGLEIEVLRSALRQQRKNRQEEATNVLYG